MESELEIILFPAIAACQADFIKEFFQAFPTYQKDLREMVHAALRAAAAVGPNLLLFIYLC